jgi:AraC-like DNA-binding protein
MTSIYRRIRLPKLMASRFDISYAVQRTGRDYIRVGVRRRRLLRCRAELDGADAEASITEIAYRWGCNDPAHFSRLFKASFGMSPTQYRSSRRLGASDK